MLARCISKGRAHDAAPGGCRGGIQRQLPIIPNDGALQPPLPSRQRNPRQPHQLHRYKARVRGSTPLRGKSERRIWQSQGELSLGNGSIRETDVERRCQAGLRPSKPLWRRQVVTLEQPELEERHHDLVTSIATDQKQLLDIEDQILKLLNEASSGVEVLDDEVRATCDCILNRIVCPTQI